MAVSWPKQRTRLDPLALVEQFNPSQHLFKRLGFVTIQEDGYNNLMQWRHESSQVS